jgi:hypothetical protein
MKQKQTRQEMKSEFVCTMSFCNKCIHFKGWDKCEAFDEIPERFHFEEKHTEIVAGQKGNFVYFERV